MYLEVYVLLTFIDIIQGRYNMKLEDLVLKKSNEPHRTAGNTIFSTKIPLNEIRGAISRREQCILQICLASILTVTFKARRISKNGSQKSNSDTLRKKLTTETCVHGDYHVCAINAKS